LALLMLVLYQLHLIMALQCHCEAIENGRGNLKFSK
jgi:hypothetical protein